MTTPRSQENHGAPNLVGFCEDVMRSWPEGAPDGFELQEIAAKHGLLTPEERTTFCGDEDSDECHSSCVCAEYHDKPELGFTCYRRAPLSAPSHRAAVVTEEMVERAEDAYCVIAGVHVMPGAKERHMRGLRAALAAALGGGKG